MKKLKWVSSISESEAVGDLVTRHRGRITGGQSLGWHRGVQAGVHSSYLTLKEFFPEAAKALIDAYGMNEDGDISLGKKKK